MLTKAVMDRLNRALVGASAGMLKILAKFHLPKGQVMWQIWSAMSDQRNPSIYQVIFDPSTNVPGERWTCTCQDFARHGHQTPCKHVLLAQLEHQQRVEA